MEEDSGSQTHRLSNTRNDLSLSLSVCLSLFSPEETGSIKTIQTAAAAATTTTTERCRVLLLPLSLLFQSPVSSATKQKRMCF